MEEEEPGPGGDQIAAEEEGTRCGLDLDRAGGGAVGSPEPPAGEVVGQEEEGPADQARLEEEAGGGSGTAVPEHVGACRGSIRDPGFLAVQVVLPQEENEVAEKDLDRREGWLDRRGHGAWVGVG